MICGTKYAKGEPNNLQLTSNTKYLTVGLKCRHLCGNPIKYGRVILKSMEIYV
jgi:hypothetical protein